MTHSCTPENKTTDGGNNIRITLRSPMRYEGVIFTFPVGRDAWRRGGCGAHNLLFGTCLPSRSLADLERKARKIVLYLLSLLGLWRRPKKNVHHARWCSCQGADACRHRQDFEACTAWKANQEGQGLYHPGEDSESEGEGRCPGTHGTSGDSSSFLSLTRHPGPTQHTVGHPPSATTALEHHWADLHRAQGRPQEGT